MHLSRLRRATTAVICSALACTYARAQVLADFERAAPDVLTLSGANSTLVKGDAPQGMQFARLAGGSQSAGLRVRLGESVDLHPQQLLRFAMRVESSEPKVKGRWFAIDGGNRVIFQRPFELAPGASWQTVEEPLLQWRWGSRFAGRWDDVRSIALRVETAGATVDLDAVEVAPAPTKPGESGQLAWVRATAFSGAGRFVSGDGLIVGTDATEALSEADLQEIHKDMARARQFVRREFASLVRESAPATAVTEPVLLIFRDGRSRLRGLRRLGEAWRVSIAEARSEGYTVGQIATATFKPNTGARRPVYLHEALHAIAACELGIMAGHERHSWLQEGLASYLQAAVYPGSMDRKFLIEAFTRPIDSDGGAFKPLERLLSEPVTVQHYIQLSTLVGYLFSENRELLNALVKGVASGEPPAAILAANGTSFEQLQEAWFQWGRSRFSAKTTSTPSFPLPQDFDSAR